MTFHKNFGFNEPFYQTTAFVLVKRYTRPRVELGNGKFANYFENNEPFYRIGYRSKKIFKKFVGATSVATKKEIEDQLVEDLEELAIKISPLIQQPLNLNQRAAVLSYAHSVGLGAFRESKLLEILNKPDNKLELIREWSPYIKYISDEGLRNRRRSELDLYLAPHENVALLGIINPHKCSAKHCLFNIHTSFNGNPNQIKAIEYLEKKLDYLDPSGCVQAQFWKLWSAPVTQQTLWENQ